MALIDIGDADDFQRAPLEGDAHGGQDIRPVANADFSTDFRVRLLRLVKLAAGVGGDTAPDGDKIGPTCDHLIKAIAGFGLFLEGEAVAHSPRPHPGTTKPKCQSSNTKRGSLGFVI